jgi:hypothetical protein
MFMEDKIRGVKGIESSQLGEAASTIEHPAIRAHGS